MHREDFIIVRFSRLWRFPQAEATSRHPAASFNDAPLFIAPLCARITVNRYQFSCFFQHHHGWK